MILIIYRIPYSSKDPVTTATLFEEFTTYLESFIIKLLSWRQKVDAGEKVSFECWESIVETYDLDYL